MADRPPVTDAPQSAPSTGSSLFERSGFMSGLKKIGHSATQLVEDGVEQGKKLANSDTAKKLRVKATEATQEIATSPTTGRIIQGVKQSGTNLARQDVAHADGALNAARNGDVVGVIAHVAPLAEQSSPAGMALKIGKDVAISQASPEHQAALRQISGGLPNLSISGLARSAALHQAEKGTIVQASAGDGKDVTGQATSFLKGWGAKLHLTKDNTDVQPEKK